MAHAIAKVMASHRLSFPPLQVLLSIPLHPPGMVEAVPLLISLTVVGVGVVAVPGRVGGLILIAVADETIVITKTETRANAHDPNVILVFEHVFFPFA